MLDTWLRRKKVRANVDITWSTYEQSYIQAFGPRCTRWLQRVRAQVVAGHTEFAAEQVKDGEVRYSNGEVLPYDLLVAFSPYVAQVNYPTFPGTTELRPDRPRDPPGRRPSGRLRRGRRRGLPRAGLPAFPQADAEHLSARARHEPRSPSSRRACA